MDEVERDGGGDPLRVESERRGGSAWSRGCIESRSETHLASVLTSSYYEAHLLVDLVLLVLGAMHAVRILVSRVRALIRLHHGRRIALVGHCGSHQACQLSLGAWAAVERGGYKISENAPFNPQISLPSALYPTETSLA